MKMFTRLICSVALLLSIYLTSSVLAFQPTASDGFTMPSPKDRMGSCNPNVALQAANELLNDPSNFSEPLELFGPALVLYRNGRKDEAVFWYTAAELRTRYSLVYKKGDRGQLFTIMQMTVGAPILNYAFQNINNYVAIIDRVITWDKGTPNPFRQINDDAESQAQIQKIFDGLAEYKRTLLEKRQELEEKALHAAPEMQTIGNASNTCSENYIDPEYVSQALDREKKMVLDYVKANPEIKKLSGTTQNAFVGSYLQNNLTGDRMPIQYDVDINLGVNGAVPIYALIDVTRNKLIPTFKLRCATTVPPGNRERGKDPCSK